MKVFRDAKFEKAFIYNVLNIELQLLKAIKDIIYNRSKWWQLLSAFWGLQYAHVLTRKHTNIINKLLARYILNVQCYLFSQD